MKSLFTTCGKDVCCSAAVSDICCDVFYRTTLCQVCLVARCLAVCCIQCFCPSRLCNYYKNQQVLPAICNSPWQIFSSKVAFVLWSLSLSLLPDLWGELPLLCGFTTQVKCGQNLGATTPNFVPERCSTAQPGKTLQVRAHRACEA